MLTEPEPIVGDMRLREVRGARSFLAWSRARLLGVLGRLAITEKSREMISPLLHEHNAVPTPQELRAFNVAPPYVELGAYAAAGTDSKGSPPPIFITGRFRSGSTLLWNLFRSARETTSYYEPFHERRWFDPIARGERVDPSHRGVSNYWAEYNGLQVLGRYFDVQWKFRQLYMPAAAWNPRMRRYIELLIEHCPNRAVLQFNSMDFRLPWLRARFPHAPVIHIFRHPRDQWCSTLLNDARRAAKCRLREFPSLDWFYLLRWARDLRHYFPFLTLEREAHAYELYYQIWRLSHLFGQLYADLSVPFEHLVAEPRAGVRAILNAAGMEDTDAEPLVALVKPVTVGKWRQCAAGEWFAEIESRVDAALAEYAAADNSLPIRICQSRVANARASLRIKL